MINAGSSPIIEPGLADLVSRVVRQGRLSATDSAEEGIADADVALICVGTPDLGHGQPDYDGLARVASAIGAACESRTRPLTVVLRSTVLPGTTERVLARVLSECSGGGRMAEPLRIAVNPEFMREGSSIEDFDQPPFVLVGCDDPDTATALRAAVCRRQAPFLQTSVRTAEMVKYVCNAFHALKITFTNEIADLCDALGADAQDVMRVFRQDKKLNIAPAYLKPGFAFGGSCLPKDVRALLCSGRIYDVSTPVLTAVVQSNKAQIARGVDAVLQTRKKKIGVIGLAFKSNTDDLRESPMVTLVETLIGKGLRREDLRPERRHGAAEGRQSQLHRAGDSARVLAAVRHAGMSRRARGRAGVRHGRAGCGEGARSRAARSGHRRSDARSGPRHGAAERREQDVRRFRDARGDGGPGVAARHGSSCRTAHRRRQPVAPVARDRTHRTDRTRLRPGRTRVAASRRRRYYASLQTARTHHPCRRRRVAASGARRGAAGRSHHSRGGRDI